MTTPTPPTARHRHTHRPWQVICLGLLWLVAVTSIGATEDQGQPPTFDLAGLLDCRSTPALATALETIASAAETHGFACRSVSTAHRNSLTCTSERRFAVIGAPVKEFTLSQPGDGSASLSVALNAPTSRIQKALADRKIAAPDGAISVDQREDGAAELRCQHLASTDHTASISGRLSFRGVEPLPAMRVCAAATNDPENPVCVNSQPGDRRYRVTGLPGGHYFLTAFPLANNPNRVFVVHSAGPSSCVDSAPACSTTRLQPVELRANQHRDGIDLETLLPQLPASMGRRHR